jgi:HK97 family phage major capsid protein
MSELLTFSADLVADEASRTITGKIVPFNNEIGYTSAGKVIFESGSIELPESGRVKLLLEHDAKKPLGWSQMIQASDDEMIASFKLSKTQRASDALAEAADELRAGLSVGVEVIKSKIVDGVIHVTSALLKEVSLVQAAAFASAAVTSVLAEESKDEAVIEQTLPTESETVAVDNTPTVEATPVEAAAVEAARPTVTAMAFSKPRFELSKEKYLENSIRASVFHDDEARQYLAFAADTTDNAGLIPTRQLTEVINPLSNADRPFIDAISRGTLPDAGMTFEIPKISQVPTVAVTAEAAAPSETDMNTSFLSVSVAKYSGSQVFSSELLYRSSPEFYAELVRQMEFAYAKATNAAVGTAVNTGATDGGNRTLTAANLLDFISDAAVSVYTNTLGFATNLVVSPEQWGAIMGLVDGSNRPLYVQTINPQNASANLTPTGVRGNVHGLNLYVSRSLSGTGDGTMVVIDPQSYTWYESPTFTLESNKISTGQIEVSYNGFGAIATKVAAGAYKWMVA